MLLTRRRLLTIRPHAEVWPGLRVHSRSEWTDSEPTAALEEEEVRFLLVHHTAGNTEHRVADVPRILAGIRSFHVSQKGWPDIAYNFLIDRYGGVWEGRAGSLDHPIRGDATGGNQGFSQLVCLIGDFATELPSEEAQHSLVLTLAWLADRYGIDTSSESTVSFTSRGSNRWPEGTLVTTTPIAGHRDMSHTSCPGDAFYAVLAERITPMVEEARVTPSSTTTAPEAVEPPTTSSTSTTTTTVAPSTTSAPTTSTTTTLAAAGDATSVPPQAAADTGSGLSGLFLSGASFLAGAVVAVIGWRVRRMSQAG